MRTGKIILVAILAAGLSSTAMAVWSETFSYPDSALGNNGTWGGGAQSKLQVVSQELQVSSGGGDQWNWNTSPNEVWPVVTVTADIRGTGAFEGFWWYMYIGDTSNSYSLGYWYGGKGLARSRQGGSVFDNDISDGQWHQIKAEVDTVANETRFYFDGNHNHTVTHIGTPTGVGLVEFNSIDRPDIVGSIFIDNINITPEPASLALLGLGGLVFLRRRR